MSKTVYIHAGSHKTGSSYLQHIFHLNKDYLQDKGIIYPHNGKSYHGDWGAKHIIHNGNGYLISPPFEELEEILKSISNTDHHGLLLSTEAFIKFSITDNNPNIQVPLELLKNYGYDNIKVLIFVRNPIEHASSLWLELVKMQYESESLDSLDEYYKRYRYIRETMYFLQDLESRIEIDLTLHNFSICKDAHVSMTENWLGFNSGSLQKPEMEILNRSMTIEELFIAQKRLHKLGHHKKFGAMLGQIQTTKKSRKIFPSKEAQASMLENNREAIDWLNARMPSDHALQTKIISNEGQDSESFFFEEGQLSEILKYFAEESNHLEWQLQQHQVKVPAKPAKPRLRDRIRKKLYKTARRLFHRSFLK